MVKRSGKKGTRGPPPCKPFPSPPTGPEAFINTALLSLPQPSPHITHMLKEQSLKRGREGDNDGQETRTRGGRSVLVAPGLPRLVTVDEEEKEWEFSKFDLEDLEAGLWPLSGGAPSVDDPLDPDYDPASFEAALSGYPLSPLPPPPPKRAPPALPSLTHSGDTGGPSADLEPDFAALLSGLI